MTTLRYKDKGEGVKKLQRLLKKQGFYKGEFDGKFLKELQKKDSTRAIKIRRKTMNRKAVCVGISTFRENAVTPLPGCANDAKLLANILQERYGFSGDDIRLLIDERATREAILARLNWLVEGAGSGDVLVYTAASHGTFSVDTSGDEEDGRDEVFVPYDYDFRRGIGIRDDEIGEILGKVPPGARLYCILDTCHSATATRSLPTREQQELEPVNRFLPPPPEATRDLRSGLGWRKQRVSHDDTMNRISISGCQDDESSWDYRTPAGKNHGLMTYSLYRALEESGWQGSVADIFQQVHTEVLKASKRFPAVQTPQLHGPDELRNAKLFR